MSCVSTTYVLLTDTLLPNALLITSAETKSLIGFAAEGGGRILGLYGMRASEVG